MSVVRRALWLALVAVFALGTAAPALASDGTAASASTGTASIARTGSHTTSPCIRDAGCGGGGALSSGGGPLLVTLGSGVIVVALTLTRRRHAWKRPLPTSRLLAGRLFHPPRLSLGF